MSDRICVLSGGVLQQLGSPYEVYNRPETRFVAEFFGRSNSFDGTVASTAPAARVDLGRGLTVRAAHLPPGVDAGDRVRITIRQESLVVSADPSPETDNSFSGTLELVSFAGSSVQFVVRIAEGFELTGEARLGRGQDLPRQGLPVSVGIPASEVIVMAAE